MRRTALALGIVGAAIIAGSVGLNRKDEISRYVTSTGIYQSGERGVAGASRLADRLSNYRTYSVIEKEFEQKTAGNDVFLVIGASWCYPCQRLESYLETKKSDFTGFRIEHIELDGGDIENSSTSHNRAVKYALQKRCMLSGDTLSVPLAFIISGGSSECFMGYLGDGKMRKCDTMKEVKLVDKLKK